MRKQGRGGITKIADLFAVYKLRLKAPQGAVVKAFSEVVLDLLNIQVKDGWCSYSVTSRMLYISSTGPFKSEILMHKKEILTHLKGRLGEKSAPNDIL